MPDPQAAAEPATFPPQPWRLKGEAELSAWLVPAASLAFEPPAGWRPVGVFGRRLVGAVFARYAPGGDLAYRELAVGVAVRKGLRLAVTIPWIWVDDPRALEGGRRLWAIPKAPARFRRAGAGLEAEDAGGRPIAAVAGGPGLPLAVRARLRLLIAQPHPAGPRLTPARVAGRFSLARLRWRAGAPLGFLSGALPLVGLRLAAAELTFGAAEGFG
jgi:hypothetical protein